MCKKKSVLTFIIVMMLMLSTILGGCTRSANSNSTANKAKKGVATYTELGSWAKPPLYQGNNFAAAGVGWPVYALVYEGLYQYVRTTDYLYLRLATGLPATKGNETTVHLRHDVKWNDGKPFTSKDIWAYYILNNGSFITKFLTSIETPDDYTVVFKWADPQPNDTVKKMLISQDNQATIPYHLFSKYVDKANDILSGLKTTNDLDKRGAFTKYIDSKATDELNQNWNDFIKYKMPYPVGTGAFKVQTVTSAELILVKNPYYYNKNLVKFDRVHLYQTDQAGGWALTQTGRIAQNENNPTKDIAMNLLKKNKNLVFYPMKDLAGFGVMFNIKKAPFNDVNVRRALEYVADRNKIKDVSNWMGIVSDISVIGMPTNMMNWITQDVKDKMTKYGYDPDKASELLKEDGWQKGTDGIWKDKNGKSYNFSIGADAGWGQIVNAGEVLAEQLTKFGLHTKLTAADSSIYYKNAQRPNNKYDMSSDWVDISDGFELPWWPLSRFWQGAPASEGNFPTVTKQGVDYGKLDMQLPGPDGKVIDINKAVNDLFYMSEDEMKATTSKLAWIANENAYGIDYFLNVATTFLDTSFIDKDGLPMHDEFAKYNRNMPLPTDPDDIEKVADLNFGHDNGEIPLVDGSWKPAEKAYNIK